MTIKLIRKLFFSFLLLLISEIGFTQIKQAILGINGLTCSQCSRSVEMQLRKLDFIKNIEMNLSQTEAILLFKDKKRIEWEKIPKAVNDAGFSTRSLFITIDFSEIVQKGNCFLFQNRAFASLGNKFPDSGIHHYQIIQKDFLPKKAWSKIEVPQKNECSSRAAYYLSEI